MMTDTAGSSQIPTSYVCSLSEWSEWDDLQAWCARMGYSAREGEAPPVLAAVASGYLRTGLNDLDRLKLVAALMAPNHRLLLVRWGLDVCQRIQDRLGELPEPCRDALGGLVTDDDFCDVGLAAEILLLKASDSVAFHSRKTDPLNEERDSEMVISWGLRRLTTLVRGVIAH